MKPDSRRPTPASRTSRQGLTDSDGTETGDGTETRHSGAQERVLDVLEALADLAPQATLLDLAARCGLPKPTTHRILALLTSRGYASQAGDRLYAPGLKWLSLAGKFRDKLGITDLALPVMRDLQAKFSETVHFGVLEGDHAVYVAKVDGRRPYRLTSRVGMEIPLHCTAIGKAILSVLDPAQRAGLLNQPLSRKTEHTITHPNALEAELASIARQGYAIDNEENERDVRCIAAPVVGSRGLYGAVSISAPVFDMPLAKANALGPEVIAAAAELSAGLTASVLPEELYQKLF